MSTNFLLDKFIGEFPSGAITAGQLQDFINRALGDSDNFRNLDPVTGVPRTTHSVTIVWSGSTGTFNGNVAKDLASRMGGEARVLELTRMGQFLEAVNQGALGERVNLQGDAANVIKQAWNAASSKFVAEGRGKLIAITGANVGSTSVLFNQELPDILKGANYTEINGIKISDLKASTVGLNDITRNTYALSAVQSAFAKATQDQGLKVYQGPVVGNYVTSGAIDFNATSLTKLGYSGPLSAFTNPNNIPVLLDEAGFNKEIRTIRAKSANLLGLLEVNKDQQINWLDRINDKNSTQLILNKRLADALEHLKPGTTFPQETGAKLLKAALDGAKDLPESASKSLLTTAAQWTNSLLKEFPNPSYS